MAESGTIKQLVIENRNIIAEICDEGGRLITKLPVFAWVLYDNDDIEPLFIHKDYQVDEQPYGIDCIKRISGQDLGITHYNWIKQ